MAVQLILLESQNHIPIDHNILQIGHLTNQLYQDLIPLVHQHLTLIDQLQAPKEDIKNK